MLLFYLQIKKRYFVITNNSYILFMKTVVNDIEGGIYHDEYLNPHRFDKRVAEAVTTAVEEAAIKRG
jgi:hypothetical protein